MPEDERLKLADPDAVSSFANMLIAPTTNNAKMWASSWTKAAIRMAPPAHPSKGPEECPGLGYNMLGHYIHRTFEAKVPIANLPTLELDLPM